MDGESCLSVISSQRSVHVVDVFFVLLGFDNGIRLLISFLLLSTGSWVYLLQSVLSGEYISSFVQSYYDT